MPRRSLPPRKRRTREHVIADLSVNFVERQALLCGFSAEKPLHDYGVDLLLFTYTDQGEPEGGEVRIQVKATDRLQTVRNGAFVAIEIERADVRSWILQPMPVILVVYDAANDLAFWLYVQAHFGGVRRFRTSGRSAKMTFRIPVAQTLTPAGVRSFQSFRDAIAGQIQGVRHEQQ